MTHDHLRSLCLSHPGVTEDQPFGEDTLVFRVGGKIFALLALDAFPARINLKCDPERAVALREQYAAILPGYHMNKRHWNTLVADGSIERDEVAELVAHAYRLVRHALPRKVQAALP